MSDLDRLKQLLLAEEREDLARAQQRLDQLEQKNRELAAILPALVRAAPQEPMTRALASPVAAALGSAVRDNRSSIVDALFPVIGPIIRKAIAEALRGLMSDLNRVLEHGFSPRGIRWRIEAWRSGVPFAQIVLRHTLRYSIDHLFLIERDSGLVLHRESAPGLPDLDADAIAGMLTAIGQFVRDSVGREGEGSLEAARVGEHLLWVLDGPRASLACFISGVPQESLRGILSDRLEQIHAQWPDAVDAGGPAAPAGQDWQEALDPVALVAASAAITGDAAPASAGATRWPLLIILILLLGAAGWYFVRNERWQSRVESVRGTLAAQPGFLLTGIDSEPWKSLVIHGVLDSDAEPLQPLLAAADLGGVRPQWELKGYVSSADPILEKRARRLLDPPAGVSLAVRQGVLTLQGSADAEWIRTARERAAWIAGVRDVDWQVAAPAASGPDPDALARAAAHAKLVALADELARARVIFVDDSQPSAEGLAQLARIAADLQQAGTLAREARASLRLHILGHTDASGSAETNRRLRAERAAWLRDRLGESGVPADWLRDAQMGEDVQDDDSEFRGASLRLAIAANEP
jgi:outer membrane protein OmpA-like peptidoglycan-associated protein